jgi:DNA-binding XRE family transcriptional regulator
MTGYVYAIQCGDAVKIGFSQNPRRRLRKVQTDAIAACSLLGCVEATTAQEAELHGLLAPARISGEWFSLASELVGAFVQLVSGRSLDLPDGSAADRIAPNNGLSFVRKALLKLTQVKFARIAGASQATVSRWETGELEPSMSQLRAIRDAAVGAGLEWNDSWLLDAPDAPQQTTEAVE